MTLDSSALIAILFSEPGFLELVDCILEADAVRVGAPTLVETGIVLAGRKRGKPGVSSRSWSASWRSPSSRSAKPSGTLPVRPTRATDADATRPPSTSAIASPTPLLPPPETRCCLSAATSATRTSLRALAPETPLGAAPRRSNLRPAKVLQPRRRLKKQGSACKKVRNRWKLRVIYAVDLRRDRSRRPALSAGRSGTDATGGGGGVGPLAH